MITVNSWTLDGSLEAVKCSRVQTVGTSVTAVGEDILNF